MSGRYLSALVLGAALAAFTSTAFAYSGAVTGACRADYKRFCSAHAINDPGLRRCMDQAGRSLSQACVVALVNTGEVSKARATQRWGHSF
ncbi:MAG: hypothetical protein KDJ72_08835 [Methyloceanibacter sp.]|uniref:hypothetical protein n=1 Tax=Methyloceanibacter sp. TaxID=1965321 RepID=UPI001D71DDFA|nr:hypothetical protein [Methyloceanibacter sp.]MCB1443116.1 hypothetical protein [Methyloceanibacter sp.]MCC0057860.1 hypothetical protein [Hyphomicrobiaceae bacterium]